MTVLKKHEDSALGNKLIPTPSYYDIKKKERKEAELRKDSELKEIFLNALSFYNENYPESFQKRPNTWVDTKQDFTIDETFLLTDILKCSTIEELYLMALIIKYSLDEKNYKRIPTRDMFLELRGMIIKMIPGGRETMSIKALQEEQNITNLKIRELRKRKKEKLGEFEYNLKEAQETIKPIEIPEEPQPIVNKAIGKKCPYCEEIKGNKAGMTSHVMHKHKDVYEIFKIEFKEQMWVENEEKQG